LLAQTRAVWIALALALTYYGIKQQLFRKPVALISLGIAGSLALGLVIATLGSQNIYAQVITLFTQADSSSNDRISTMKAGLNFIAKQTLVIGVGPGNQDAVYASKGDDLAFDATTHSMYLDTAIQIGVLGLLAYVWLLVRSWKEAGFVAKYSNTLFFTELSNGFRYMLVAVVIMHVFQGNLFGNPKTNLLVWGLFGLVSVARKLTLQQIKIQDNQ